MEKKHKPLKILGIIILIPILFVLVVTIIIAVSTFVEFKQAANVQEEFAVDYLIMFSNTFKNPHSIKVHKVWVYTDSDNRFYVAYNLSASNSFGAEVEGTYGNNSGIFYLDADSGKKDVEAVPRALYFCSLDLGELWEESYSLEAIKMGRKLDAEKIQKAFEKGL